MMSAVDRSFTDQSTLQEDERLGLSFMAQHKLHQPQRGLNDLLWGSDAWPASFQDFPAGPVVKTPPACTPVFLPEKSASGLGAGT